MKLCSIIQRMVHGVKIQPFLGYLQVGPEKILLETIDSFVVYSNFCEPPCIDKLLNF